MKIRNLESGIKQRERNRNQAKKKKWICFEGVPDKNCANKTFHLHELYLFYCRFCSFEEQFQRISHWQIIASILLKFLRSLFELSPPCFGTNYIELYIQLLGHLHTEFLIKSV